MINIKDLTYKVKDKTLINKASANFESGKIHLILGPNGAGKSTLIKLISGELKPTLGSVFIENTDLQNISHSQLAKHRAVLSQNIELSFPLIVEEVVMMGRYPHFDSKPSDIDKTICIEAMKFFNVYEMRQRNYLTLSGGEKQRVQFARVFAQIWNPVKDKLRLLLLDEPLTFLDIFYQYDLIEKIKNFMNINPDLTVIGIVHDLNIAAKYADKIMLLKDTSIFDYGFPQEVLTEKNILDVFRVAVTSYFKVVSERS